jgi:hypothetical protein
MATARELIEQFLALRPDLDERAAALHRASCCEEAALTWELAGAFGEWFLRRRGLAGLDHDGVCRMADRMGRRVAQYLGRRKRAGR